MVIWHVVLGIVANVFTLYLPRLISHVIDAYLQGTIENADGIFFVGGGEVALAGFMENAVSMLLHGESKS